MYIENGVFMGYNNHMKKSIQFTVTDEEKERFIAYAKEKGFYNVSALAKRALFAYVLKYPQKANTDTSPHPFSA